MRLPPPRRAGESEGASRHRRGLDASECATGPLATVVETPARRTGGRARMPVLDDGCTTAGSISGGCLEADVIERGPRSVVRRVPGGDLRHAFPDADPVWGLPRLQRCCDGAHRARRSKVARPAC
ncbi:MAG: XdhC family protein [Blastocatellia bacterium]|nr:XdhC family protein [Blastocatellia bacterium]